MSYIVLYWRQTTEQAASRHISLIVILLFECCFVTHIDCIHVLSSCISVYYCGLTVVLLKKHLIFLFDLVLDN